MNKQDQAERAGTFSEELSKDGKRFADELAKEDERFADEHSREEKRFAEELSKLKTDPARQEAKHRLGLEKLGAFVATTDARKARSFYVDVLGLRFVSDDQFALVVDANGTTIRVSKVGEFTPQNFTVLGWEVSDIERTVTDLERQGVNFEKYGLQGQDERGIWTAPMIDNVTAKARVAWFKDPDGNVLSVTQIA